MNHQSLTYLLVLLFFCAFSYGQTIPFKNYTVRDEGLPSNYVSDIVQDNKGYIWFATDFGLSKFDGYNFRNYTIFDGLSDNYVKCLTVDKQDRIWVGTEIGGITVVDGLKTTIISSEDGLFSEPVDEIFCDKSGNIWACAAEDGVSIIKKDTIITYNSGNSILESNVFCHFIDTKGTIWLGNYDGVYYYDTALHFFDSPYLSDKSVWSILESSDGAMWFATEVAGAVKYKSGQFTQFNTNNGLNTNTCLSLAETKDGHIYIGTHYGGISIIKGDTIDNTFADLCSDYLIWELKVDSYNRIWARTHENGLLLMANGSLQNITKENNLVSDYVLKVFEDSYNNIWLVTEDGVSKYGKVFFETYQDNLVWDDNHVLSLFIEEDIYVGSYSGLSIIKTNGETQHITSENGLYSKPTVGSIANFNKTIWLGTYGIASKIKDNKISHFNSNFLEEVKDLYARDLIITSEKVYAATDSGLCIIDLLAKEYKYHSILDGTVKNKFYSLAIDSTNKIWCGSADGLFIFDGQRFYSFTTQDGLPNNFCNDICFDAYGTAWIATDYGVCKAILDADYKLNTTIFTSFNGLQSNSTVSIISDNNGYIWIGSNKGVDRLNPTTNKIKNYGEKEGFLPIETNSGAIHLDKKGNIWFGTVDGIVKYNPQFDKENDIATKAFITNIKLYNDTASLRSYYTELDAYTQLPINLSLPHSKRNIFFEYVGLHYTIVEKNKYKYRLLGYDENWSDVTSDIKTIPYQKLSHGKYTFQLMAANCDNIWTKEPVEFSFRILPPWWKTWWARIIEVVILIGLLYLIIYLRERKLKYDKKILQEKVKDRTAEVVNQKEQIEKQRDEITLQKREITDSIHYAEHIQSALLPKDDTISAFLKEYFILFKPRDIVSGDFYWIDKIDNKVIVIAADCTGHGVPGAFMSMLGVSILNQISISKKEIGADEILNQLRDKIISTLSHTRKDEEARDGMDIALCIFDFKKNSVEFSGAYNPLIVIRNGELEIFKADKMPVGSMPGEQKPFSSQQINLKKGDNLYMFSDGYADQFGGEFGKKFKSAPFKRLLCDISNKSMYEQKQILNKTIMDWMKNEEQIDDILVLGIRI